MTTSAMKNLELATWHAADGANASAAFGVRGFDLAPVLVSAMLSPGDKLEALVEGRRLGGEWRNASARIIVASIMKIPSSVVTTGPAITVNLNIDTFDELRVVWTKKSGDPRDVVARVGLRLRVQRAPGE